MVNPSEILLFSLFKNTKYIRKSLRRSKYLREVRKSPLYLKIICLSTWVGLDFYKILFYKFNRFLCEKSLWKIVSSAAIAPLWGMTEFEIGFDNSSSTCLINWSQGNVMECRAILNSTCTDNQIYSKIRNDTIKIEIN